MKLFKCLALFAANAQACIPPLLFVGTTEACIPPLIFAGSTQACIIPLRSDVDGMNQAKSFCSRKVSTESLSRYNIFRTGKHRLCVNANNTNKSLISLITGLLLLWNQLTIINQNLVVIISLKLLNHSMEKLILIISQL